MQQGHLLWIALSASKIGCYSQDKLLRTLMLECISLTVRTYLRRQPQREGSGTRERSDAWLARTTKPIMVNVRKGNFQFPEQQVGQLLVHCACGPG